MERLESLIKKHGELQESYTQQSKVMVQLEARIAELTAELSTLRYCQPGSNTTMVSHGCQWDSFKTFDAVMLPSGLSFGQGDAQNIGHLGNPSVEDHVMAQIQKLPESEDLLFFHRH